MPNRYLAHISHADRHAFVGPHNNVADVLRVAHESNAAHIVELSTLRIEAATRVRVICGQSGGYLRDCQVIPIDAGGIEKHLVLPHRPAESRGVRDAVDGAIGSFDDPIFDCLQVLRAPIRTLEYVSVYEAAGAEQWSEGRSYSCGQRSLCQSLRYALTGEAAVGV